MNTLISLDGKRKYNVNLDAAIGKTSFREWLASHILRYVIVLKKQGEFKHQKAQNNFWSPAENRTHDPLSSGSDAFV